MECLHDTLPEGYRCDAEAAYEEQWVFGCSFEGGKVPLRSGVIKSWWTGEGTDTEIRWTYDGEPDTPAAEPVIPESQEVPGPETPALADFFGGHRAPIVQRHRISFFVSGQGIEFTLDCLHEPASEDRACDSRTAQEDPEAFYECLQGDKVPLRDGVIESWWERVGDNEYDLAWKYSGE